MKKGVTTFITVICGCVLIAALFIAYNYEKEPVSIQERIDRKLSASSEEEESGKEEMKKARYEYFFRMLRDPATNSIPKNIRARELRYAKTLPTIAEAKARLKSKNPGVIIAPEFDWSLAGPSAVGGRTRALGIDQRNPNIIIAGGVSGGIWKSADGGNSWDLKTPDAENLSVTSLAQDPSNPDTWYYTSGEFTGNSSGATGAPHYGNGVYISTDNGETWSRIPNTEDDDIDFNSPYDFISRVVVSPTSGSVFIASNGIGVYRSTNTEPFPADPGPGIPPPNLGTAGGHLFVDVAVASDGRLAAVLSSQNAGEPNNNPGIFISTDDGDSWDEIDYISSFPSDHGRSVLTFAPSNPDLLYVLTNKSGDATNQGASFFRINLTSETFEDRSANLPDFGEPVGGLNFQGGYNMVVSVKPNDPDYVFVGGTNLFRSTDGFATAPSGNTDSEKNQFWIGGYNKDNDISQYPNQHADQHIVAFDPTNPDRMWAGTDGGIYVTGDVSANSVSWSDQNEGYIVTQFYAAALPQSASDNRFMGGSQDNGTPFFTNTSSSPDSTFDISSGDGGHSFFSENYLFVSSQRGRILRWNNSLTELNYLFPSGVTRDDLLFINPYVVDPNDENIMYYADVDHIWRNSSLDQVSNGNSSSGNGTSVGWEEVNAVNVPNNYIISALDVSKTPSDILYYAGSSSGTGQPVIRRLDNATSSTSPVNIPLPSNSILGGAYIHDIAVNPINANEAIVILSNYDIPSIYHTIDAGDNWENIGGNLEGSDLNTQNDSNPGPSIRSAAMIPAEGGIVYVVGTSTGVYSTQNLDGTNTEWGQEGATEVGFAVVEQIASRQSNGDVAAGTHGRGMYLGSFQGSTSFPFVTTTPVQARTNEVITITANNFTFSSTPSENQVLFRARDIKQTNLCQNVSTSGVSGEVVAASASSIDVRVPRGILPDECAESNSVTLAVSVNGQEPDPSPTSFTVLPPNEFAMLQNFPNPFNPSTTIRIDLAVNSRVTLTVYDMLGQKVREPIFEDEYIAGTFNTRINLSSLASGVYIYRVVATPMAGSGEPFVETKKMTLIK